MNTAPFATGDKRPASYWISAVAEQLENATAAALHAAGGNAQQRLVLNLLADGPLPLAALNSSIGDGNAIALEELAVAGHLIADEEQVIMLSRSGELLCAALNQAFAAVRSTAIAGIDAVALTITLATLRQMSSALR